MKTAYEKPEMEIVLLQGDDVVTTCSGTELPPDIFS